MVLGHDIGKGYRTQDVQISEDISFDTMLLAKNTLRGLKCSGFHKPSPIQLHGIPLGKCGFDLLLEAKSGTGKTAVFTVIALEKLDLTKGIQTIILAPTREIASQIYDVIIQIGSCHKDLNVAVVMGGLPVQDDKEKFNKNVHIVVGSPGRLRHLIHDKTIDVSSVRLLVLDEADKLMEKSFLPDINYIFSLLPKQKQVIMCSATYAEETKTFINKYVQKAQHVCPDSSSVLLGIKQKVTIVPRNINIVKQTKHRYEELKKILSQIQFKQCLIFCNYQVRVGEVHRMLTRDKWPAEQLYGQQEQTDRLDALKTLQQYKCRILVSTDLAARGIDASNVDLVINFEPPFEWQTYLHRIGRAGRYGSYGMAISILSQGNEENKFKETLALTNISFDLRDIWNGQAFHLNSENDSNDSLTENETSVHDSPNIEIVFNGKNEDLWKALTKESNEQNDVEKSELTSFEGLLDSFKKSNNPNIASFSDLLSSFNDSPKQKENTEKKNCEYKQVKVFNLFPNIQCNKSVRLDNSPRIKGHQNCVPEKNKSEVNGIKETDVPETSASGNNIDVEHNNIPLMIKSSIYGAKDIDLVECSSKKSKCSKNISVAEKIDDTDQALGDPGLSTDYHGYNTKAFQNNVDDIEQALIDAGLPTAFGKPSKNKKTCHIKKYDKDIEKSQLKDSSSISSDVGGECYQSESDYDSYQSEFNDDSDQSTFEEEGDQQECQRKSALETSSYQVKQKIYSRKTNVSDSIIQSKKKSKRYNNNVIQQRSKEFDLWYNQLRSQTQFIQQALYLEELSKI